MQDYKKFSLKLGKEAAKIIRENFQLGMKRENKEDGSPVTEADLKINRMLIEEVKKNYPGYAVLAEEESYLVEGAEFVWVCDPIDGTIPFSHGVPLSTFSLALVQNGEPILGLLVEPYRKHFYFAQKAKGAFVNNKPIKVSTKDTLTSSVVFSEYWQQAAYDILELIKTLEAQNCHVPIMKSIAYGCVMVAAGECVGVVFPGKKAWDVAAAKIIVEEAGGKVTDFYGNDQRYDQDIKGCILSNGIMHDELVRLVKECVLEK